MATAKKRLGRGLGGLIQGGSSGQAAASKKATPVAKKAAKKASSVPVAATPPPTSSPDALIGFTEIPLTQIVANPHQPRETFDAEAVTELAESIQAEGLLQPIVVRRKEAKAYELIAGERRLRAFRHLALKKIPARIVEASDTSSAVLSLVENLQRENLNPIEEARGYASLLRDFELTQEAIAQRIGKGRSAITNSLRLLTLDEETQAFLARGLISVGHAKVLLGVENPADRAALARQIIEAGLTVRQLEEKVRAFGSKRGPGTPTTNRKPTGLEAEAIDRLQKDLSSQLATRVELKHQGKKGRLVIEYHGNDDLQRLLERMGLQS